MEVVIVTEQVPEERVHTDGVKDTEPVPDCDQVMVPVGEPLEPATAAVQVVDENTVRRVLHDTTVAVAPGGIADTVGVAVPELAAFFESPP